MKIFWPKKVIDEVLTTKIINWGDILSQTRVCYNRTTSNMWYPLPIHYFLPSDFDIFFCSNIFLIFMKSSDFFKPFFPYFVFQNESRKKLKVYRKITTIYSGFFLFCFHLYKTLWKRMVKVGFSKSFAL